MVTYTESNIWDYLVGSQPEYEFMYYSTDQLGPWTDDQIETACHDYAQELPEMFRDNEDWSNVDLDELGSMLASHVKAQLKDFDPATVHNPFLQQYFAATADQAKAYWDLHDRYQ